MRVSASIVTYNSCPALLRRTLGSLSAALRYSQRQGAAVAVWVMVVDNSTRANCRQQVREVVADASASGAFDRVECWHSGANIGYGAAHNAALERAGGVAPESAGGFAPERLGSVAAGWAGGVAPERAGSVVPERAGSEFHLILNPDVELAEDALHAGLGYLRQRPDVVAVSPSAEDARGATQYLCKRHPSVLVLALRAFAPRWLRRRFRTRLHHYEMRDVCGGGDGTVGGDADEDGRDGMRDGGDGGRDSMHADGNDSMRGDGADDMRGDGADGARDDVGNRGQAATVPIISGCCMFARTAALQAVGGFCGRFFLYFEDFDLSLRLHSQGRLVHLPSMHIVHHGGNAARKGLWHVLLFVRSGWTFFWRHGWRWV